MAAPRGVQALTKACMVALALGSEIGETTREARGGHSTQKQRHIDSHAATESEAAACVSTWLGDQAKQKLFVQTGARACCTHGCFGYLLHLTRCFRALRAPRARLLLNHSPARSSPNQVLTHAARAAAKQLKKATRGGLFSHLWWPRAARAKGSG